MTARGGGATKGTDPGLLAMLEAAREVICRATHKTRGAVNRELEDANAALGDYLVGKGIIPHDGLEAARAAIAKAKGVQRG